jgi:hypothetical protein
LDDDPQSAFLKSQFQIEKYDWEIKGVNSFTVKTDYEDFVGKDIGLTNEANYFLFGTHGRGGVVFYSHGMKIIRLYAIRLCNH